MSLKGCPFLAQPMAEGMGSSVTGNRGMLPSTGGAAFAPDSPVRVDSFHQGRSRQSIDVAKNARTIDWLQAELAGSLAAIMKAMCVENEEAVGEALAGTVMLSYLLGRRLGLDYSYIDAKIMAHLHQNLKQPHEIETWYGDISALSGHWRGRRAGGAGDG